MIIKIVKDWEEPDIFRQSPFQNGEWQDHEFTFKNIDECDLLLVFTRTPADIELKAKEAWLLMHEPPYSKRYDILKSQNKYYDRVFAFWDDENIINWQTSLPWHINKNYKELANLPVGDKPNRISCIISSKKTLPGHKLRTKLIKYLKEKDFQFDLYGKGVRYIEDKFDGLYPYKYSIAMENYSCNDYWTEKIADCFLSWTMPVYWGAKNITKYFPKESMILINPEKPAEALEKIEDAIKNTLWGKNVDYIKEARELVMNKYQLFPNISELVKQSDLSEKPYKKISIPAAPTPNYYGNPFLDFVYVNTRSSKIYHYLQLLKHKLIKN